MTKGGGKAAEGIAENAANQAVGAEEAAPPRMKNDLKKLRVVDLRAELAELELPTDGVKAKLVDRLFDALNAAADENGGADAAATLQSLLAALTGSCPTLLDLTALAYLAGAGHSGAGAGGDDIATEVAERNALELFERHVGPRDEVLANAKRHADWALSDAVYAANSGVDDDVGAERYRHPQNRMMLGPVLEHSVWVRMFLGEAAAAEVLRDSVGIAEAVRGSMEVPSSRVLEEVVATAVGKTAAALPIPELLRNMLGYLRDAAAKSSAGQMLSLAAMYGLSGAMADILAGKYGEVGKDPETYELECPEGMVPGDSFKVGFEAGVEYVVVPEDVAPGQVFLGTSKREQMQAACDGIDSTLADRASVERAEEGGGSFGMWHEEMLMLMAYAFGAVLGHGNVVRQAIHGLKASISSAQGFMASSGRVRGLLLQPRL